MYNVMATGMSQDSPQNPSYFLISQTVDEGADSWGDNCVENREDIVLLGIVVGPHVTVRVP